MTKFMASTLTIQAEMKRNFGPDGEPFTPKPEAGERLPTQEEIAAADERLKTLFIPKIRQIKEEPVPSNG